MKTLAFCMALFIMVFGAVGIAEPSGLVWVAQHAVTSGAFFVIAAIRVGFGLVLISAAPVSRAPKTLRVLGWLILIAGITAALTGLLAIERPRDDRMVVAAGNRRLTSHGRSSHGLRRLHRIRLRSTSTRCLTAATYPMAIQIPRASSQRKDMHAEVRIGDCRPHGNRWHAWCCLRGWS
jgi:hypothetical protein